MPSAGPSRGARGHGTRSRRVYRAGLIAFVVFPWVMPSNWANMGVRASVWALALLSLVVLTGWIGQISLAQGALMGVGAFTAAQATTRLSLEFPFHAFVAGAAAALVATGIGIAALRIRGLYLAIATLGFQWALESSFLEWHPFSGGFNGIGIEPLRMDTYDFSNDRLFFYLAWMTAAVLFLLAANLRDSRTGRAWLAIRGSEVAARSMAIDVTRYKLIGFAVAGFIVGVAGSINLNFIGTATPLDYSFVKSITYLAVAVLGGIAHLGGALIGAVAFVFSDQIIFAGIPALRGKIEIAAAALLIITIMRNPGGLVSMREDLRERVARAHIRRGRGSTTQPAPIAGAQVDEPVEPPAPATRETPPVAAGRLEVRDIAVRFGGIHALDGVSLDIRDTEIVGLIGPNGAGKTTLFNAITGLCRPARGVVLLDDLDITRMPAHTRSSRGLSRTFQLMKLFPRLTVEQNLMIATHRTNASTLFADTLGLSSSRAEEARARDRVRAALADLGLGRHASSKVSDLPFGVLRLVDLARALLVEPSILLLDEPASGLDPAETEHFAEQLIRIRDNRRIPILLIEHDMDLVMTISDHVYVLDFGRNLADGSPREIREDERVIAAYLGEEDVA